MSGPTRLEIDVFVSVARSSPQAFGEPGSPLRTMADITVALADERDKAVELLRALRNGETVGPDVDDFLAPI
jgi:hypothetical protein